MKLRTVLATIFVSTLIFTASVVHGQAPNSHAGTNLICADCHSMHYSMQHDYDGTTPATEGPLDGGPFHYLLRKNSMNDLCLSCHEGKADAPDVLGANTGSNVREAGALTTGASPYEDWKGHTLDFEGTPPGGYVYINGLLCINCHLQHGSIYYRNLTKISVAKGTNDRSKDVFIPKYNGDGSSTLAERYSADNTFLNEPTSNKSGIGSFCRGCHTDFHGASGEPEMRNTSAPTGTGWFRHPTTDSNIGAVGGQHSSVALFGSYTNRVKVMSNSGNWGPSNGPWTTPEPDLTPTCITCHKAHGNKNPFGLIYMSGTGTVTEEGDDSGNTGLNSGVSNLCKQCHV